MFDFGEVGLAYRKQIKIHVEFQRYIRLAFRCFRLKAVNEIIKVRFKSFALPHSPSECIKKITFSFTFSDSNGYKVLRKMSNTQIQQVLDDTANGK